MNITIGATCWDGSRRKSLIEEETRKMQVAPLKFKRYNQIIDFVPWFILPVVSGLFTPMKAFAAPEAVPVIGGAIKEKIIHAFDPLIDLIMSLSFPIAGVMIAGGCLFIMVGNRERGMQMLQNAALGYILVQLTPMMLNLLVGIGGSV